VLVPVILLFSPLGYTRVLFPVILTFGLYPGVIPCLFTVLYPERKPFHGSYSRFYTQRRGLPGRVIPGLYPERKPPRGGYSLFYTRKEVSQGGFKPVLCSQRETPRVGFLLFYAQKDPPGWGFSLFYAQGRPSRTLGERGYPPWYTLHHPVYASQ